MRCAPYKKDGQIVKTQEVQLIPELLRPTGITDEQRSNYSVMREIAKETVIRPHMRKRMVEDMITETFNKNSAKEQYQMTFNLDSNQITGYQLKRPQLKQLKGKPLNIKGGMIPLQSVIKPQEFKNWVIIHDYASQKYLKQIQSNIFKCSQKLKLKIQEPDLIMLPKP